MCVRAYVCLFVHVLKYNVQSIAYTYGYSYKYIHMHIYAFSKIGICSINISIISLFPFDSSNVYFRYKCSNFYFCKPRDGKYFLRKQRHFSKIFATSPHQSDEEILYLLDLSQLTIYSVFLSRTGIYRQPCLKVVYIKEQKKSRMFCLKYKYIICRSLEYAVSFDRASVNIVVFVSVEKADRNKVMCV